MSEHNLYKQLNEAVVAAIGAVLYDQTLGGHLLAWGPTVPTDAATGYAKGCIFVHTDAATIADSLYVNVGSGSSCNFDALTNATSIVDAGSLITATTIELALQEAFQHIQTAQAFLNIPIFGTTDIDGDPLVKFANADAETPGYTTGGEITGMRWNNKATHSPFHTMVPVPPDLDASKDVIVHVLAAKTGNDGADVTTFDITVFNNLATALYDADADFGGTTSAMTAAATAKTLQEVTLTLAAANVAASPCVLSITVQPTDGTLDTDDVIVCGVWLEYTRKTLTG